MAFKLWLEEEEKDWWILRIASASKYLSGSHGSNERPAGNCYEDVEWELPYLKWPRQAEQILRDAKATVHPEDSSFASYHECQVAFWVNIHIRNEQAVEQIKALIGSEAEESLWKADKWDRITGHNFPFVNFKKALLDSIQLVNRRLQPNLPKAGQSSKDYWKDIMKRVDMKRRGDFWSREGD